MKHARFLFVLTVGLVSVLTVDAQAQGSPYTRPEDNVGSWSWGKPSARNNDDSEEREPGETSWERMQAEKAPVEKEPPRQEVLKSLSPLGLWEWWRGENKAEVAESTESTETTEAPEANEPETDESATEGE